MRRDTSNCRVAAASSLQELSVGILNWVRDVIWSFTEKRQRVSLPEAS
jgi:hypothetical protein